MGTRNIRGFTPTVSALLAERDFGPPPPENYAREVAHYGFMLIRGNEQRTVRLPLPPQEITVDEPSASVLQPTLDGGMFVERRGNLFKHIFVRGVTGNLPSANFADKGTSRQSAELSISSNLVTSLPREVAAAGLQSHALAEYSGFAKFHELRDLFRTYWATFKSDNHTLQSKTKLIWLDPRDEEAWEVEPIRFRSPRNRAYTRRYEIELRTIGVMHSSAELFGSDVLQRMFEDPDPIKIKAMAEDLDEARASLDTIYKGLPDLPTSSRAAFSQIMENINDKVMRVVTLDRLSSWEGYQTFSDSVQAAYRIFEIANLATEKHAGAHEAAVQVVRRLVEWLAQPGLFGKQWWERWALMASRFTAWQDHVLGQFSSAYGADRAFTEDARAKKFMEETGYIPVAGGGDDIESVTAPLARQSFETNTVEADETIEGLAQRCAGSALRAPEIIVANNLQYPYLVPNADERRPGTLCPGDTILIPVEAANRGNRVEAKSAAPVYSFRTAVSSYTAASRKIVVQGSPNWRRDQWVGYVAVNSSGEECTIKASDSDWFTISAAFDIDPVLDDVLMVRTPENPEYLRPGVVSSLGQDLMLVQQSDGTYTVPISPSGDFEVVGGIPNAVQAVRMFTEARPGDYPVHAARGTNAGIGEKADLDAVFACEASIRTGLVTDPRFKRVDQIRVQVQNNKFFVGMRIHTLEGSIAHKTSQPIR